MADPTHELNRGVVSAQGGQRRGIGGRRCRSSIPQFARGPAGSDAPEKKEVKSASFRSPTARRS